MKCRRCGKENPAGTRQCKHCGVPMVSPGMPRQSEKKDSQQVDSIIIAIIIALIVLISVVVGIALNQGRRAGGGGFSGGGGGGGSLPPPSFGIHTPPPSAPAQNTESPTHSPEIEIEPEDDVNDALTQKEQFIEKAKAIEEYELEFLEPAMTQMDINRESGIVLEKWDNLLNEVYQYLKEILSYSEFERLKEEELEWIKEKEAAIEEAAADWAGGSGEPMVRNLTAIEWTKNRFNYLLSLID